MRMWLRNEDLKYVLYMQESKEMNTMQSGEELAVFQKSLLLHSSEYSVSRFSLLHITSH